MKCSKCSTLNRSVAKFCKNCAHKLKIIINGWKFSFFVLFFVAVAVIFAIYFYSDNTIITDCDIVCQKLHEENAALQQEIELLTARHNTDQNTIGRLTQQINDINRTMLQLREQNERLQRENDSLRRIPPPGTANQNTINQLNQQINNLNRLIEERNRTISELRTENQALRDNM